MMMLILKPDNIFASHFNNKKVKLEENICEKIEIK